MKTNVILGASTKPDRYSNMAHIRLKKLGHKVIPVNPVEKEILGDAVVNELKDVWQDIDTLTVYINAARFTSILDDVIRIAPRRIIFNPGAEAPELYHEIPEHVEVIEACTLVMLNTGQY